MPKRRRGSRTARPWPPRRARHRPFDELVDEALATIPMPFAAALDEVAIVIADEPTPDQLRAQRAGARRDAVRPVRGRRRGPSGAPTGSPCPTGSRCSGCRSRRTSRIPTTSPTRSGSPSSTSSPITSASTTTGSTSSASTDGSAIDPTAGQEPPTRQAGHDAQDRREHEPDEHRDGEPPEAAARSGRRARPAGRGRGRSWRGSGPRTSRPAARR